MPIESSPWERLSALPVVIESYEFDRRHAEMAYGFQRVTTVVRLLGGGVFGDTPAGLPDSQLAVLPGTSHVSLVSRADLLLPMITSFLDAPMPGSAEVP